MSVRSLKSVLSTDKPGALIRLFSMKPDQVELNVSGAMKLIERLMSARVQGLDAFQKIAVVVFADQRFGNRADCGLTANAMREVLRARGLEREVYLEEVEYGDLNWGVLNHGVSVLSSAGCKIVASISPQSVDLCTDENLTSVYEAFGCGAKASCIAVYDVEGIAQGCFTNASTWWDTRALMNVGMFDEVAAMPVDPTRVLRAVGHHPVLGELVYPATGVEEIAPLLRLVDQFGECLAPVIPPNVDLDTITYALPDRNLYPDLWERKMRQLATKRPRQNLVAMSIRRDLTHLKYGVMPEYRHSPIWERPVTLEMNVQL